MSDKSLVAYGSKKKSPGVNVAQPAIPSEMPDTLYSTSFAQAVDLLGEGPIEAIHAAYFDEAIVDETDENLLIMRRLGTPDQEPLQGIPGIQTLTDVGSILLEGFSHHGSYDRSITDTDVDEIHVTFRIGGLYTTGANGMPEESRVSGWVRLLDNTMTEIWARRWRIAGKTTTGMVHMTFAVVIPSTVVAGDFPLTLRIENSDSAKAGGGRSRNDVYWRYYNEIIHEKLNYKNTALVGTEISAQRYTIIPNRAYDVSGLIIQVPSNRDNDPESGTYREYTGDWDGTFVNAWTDNPAWVVWACLTNVRWGMGHLLDPGDVDKWALYEIGKYCDELIDDGEGGTEARFTVFAVIEEPRDIYEYIQSLCQIWYGFPIWGSDTITFGIDKPGDPVHLFTQANVKNGVFKYETSAKEDRYTVVAARWNDPGNFYMPAYAPVESKVGIARYGERPIRVTAFGCKSNGQATRYARYYLYTANEETDAVSFVTGLEGATLLPGDKILVQDPVRTSTRLGGRIRYPEANQVRIDREVTFDGIESYTLAVMMQNHEQVIAAPNNTSSLTGIDYDPLNDDHRLFKVYADQDDDGDYVDVNGDPDRIVETQRYDAGTNTLYIVPAAGDGSTINYKVFLALAVQERPVTNGAETTDIVTVSPDFDPVPIMPATWILSPATAPAVEYRVESRFEDSPLEFSIRAVKVYADKHTLIEENLVIEEPPAPLVPPPGSLLPVVNLTATPHVIATPSGNANVMLEIEWADDPTNTLPATSYRVAYSWNGNPLVPLATNLRAMIVRIDDAQQGTYEIFVWARNSLMQETPATQLTYVLGNVEPINATLITGLQIAGMGSGYEFDGPDIDLVWRVNAPAGSFDDFDEDLAVDPLEPATDVELNADDASPDPWFKDYWIEVYDPTSDTPAHEEASTTESYRFPLDLNKAIFGTALDSVKFKVYARDHFLNLGPPSQITVTNPAPPLPDDLDLSGTFQGVLCRWTPPVDNDLVGIAAWMSTSAGFTPNDDTLAYKGSQEPAFFPLASLAITSGSTVYVKVACFDRFSADPSRLNLSGEYTITTHGLVGDDMPPGFIESQHVGLAVIQEAHLFEALVSRAYIRDLAVDTLKLAGNAVTALDEASLQETIRGFFPSLHSQGQWGDIINPTTEQIVELTPTTAGGQVLITGVLHAEVVHIHPYLGLADEVHDPGSTKFAQRLPLVRYRIVRNAGTGQVVVYLSGKQSVSVQGYSIGGVVARVDQPPPGQHSYRVQLQWMYDYYDAGTASGSGTTITGVGTRWIANAFRHDNFRYTNVGGGIPGPWREITGVVSSDTSLTIASGAGSTVDNFYQIITTDYSGPDVYIEPTELTLDLTMADLQASEARA
jgi:predicted phage tail protein